MSDARREGSGRPEGQAPASPTLVVFSALVLLASGSLQGTWSERRSSVDTDEAAAAIFQVPLEIGNWSAVELQTPAHPQEVRLLHREYRNRLTGRAVRVLLAAGSPCALMNYFGDRPVPETSWRGIGLPAPANLRCRHRSRQYVVHSMQACDYYDPARLDDSALSAAWGWSQSGIWESPVRPLERFDGVPVVFHVSVLQVSDSGITDADDIRDFLQVAIPEFSQTIVRGPAS